MIGQDFDHIISLGSFCQTAYQLRRLFGDRGAHVFDWWVTPSRALIDLLETGFSDLLLPENMRIVAEDAGEAVMCSRYGLMHYHDFYNAKVKDKYNPFLVRAGCQSILPKYEHLVRKFLSLEGKVLFVRVGGGHVKYFGHNSEIDENMYDRFTSALSRLNPNLEYHVLLMDVPIFGERPNLTFDSVSTYGEGAGIWSGSDAAWDQMLARQQFRLAEPQTESLPVAPTLQLKSA